MCERLEVVTGPDELAVWKERWQQLLADSATPAIYLTPEWVLSWWAGFGAGNEMHVLLLLDEGGALMAIAPLMIARQRYKKLNLDTLCFIANGHSPAADFIIRRGRVEKAVRTLIGHAKGFRSWDVAQFQKMSTRSENFDCLTRQLAAAGRPFRVHDSLTTPYVLVDTSWEEFLAHRSAKFRKVLRNTVNRSGQMGRIEVERLTIEREDRDALETMAAISSRSWKRVHGSDLSSRGNNLDFYRGLMRTMGPRGWLHLWLLRVNGAPIAFEFHLEYGRTVYPLWADYVLAFSHFSPGRLLEFSVLKKIFEERQLEEYNSCGNAYQYLLNWTSHTYQLKTVELYSGSLVSRVAYWGRTTGPVVRRMLAGIRNQK